MYCLEMKRFYKKLYYIAKTYSYGCSLDQSYNQGNLSCCNLKIV